MAKWAKRIYEWITKWRILNRVLQKDGKKMRCLYPGEAWEEQLERYYIETISLSLKIIVVGIIIVGGSLLYKFSSDPNKISSLTRNEYGDGTRYVDVVGYGREGYVLESSLQIAEREYTEQELQYLYEAALQILEVRMQGENTSLQEVKTDLVFLTEIEDFPFQISWESNDRSVINNAGQISEDYRESSMCVTVTAKLEYADFSGEHSWDVNVLPVKWTREEIWKFHVEKALQESDEESINEQVWILPTEVDGEKISWRVQEENFYAEISVLLILGVGLAIWGRNNDLQRKLKKRDESLEEEYGNVVTKLVLYLGAGMTAKSAWKKTAAAQERRDAKSALAREMLLTCREMDSGVYESVCYENFGRRCARQEYVRLGTLLSQNLKKGNSELLNRLQEEVQLSGEKRKHLVKRRGEEASTKMLVPMVLLLGVTMILIMVPAFSGIG